MKVVYQAEPSTADPKKWVVVRCIQHVFSDGKPKPYREKMFMCEELDERYGRFQYTAGGWCPIIRYATEFDTEELANAALMERILTHDRD